MYERRIPPKLTSADMAERLEAKRAEHQIMLTRRLLDVKRARDDLITFTKRTMPDPAAPNDSRLSSYEAAIFHHEVAKALMQVEAGEITQLIFAMPPRHGKTELATKRLAAWYFGRHPGQDIAVASYSDNMAEDFGGDVRAIIQSEAYKAVFPAMRLRRGGTSKSNIATVQGGRAVFVGRGGTLTGRGAHLLLLDDIFKDYAEASSPTIRDQAWNWFTKVAFTRRMGRKLVILTMTRWHSDDIIGRLTDPENPHYVESEARKWKIIRLPALAEPDDPLGREPGEALWPERFDREFLLGQQALDPLGFASLYQQTPSVADGILFNRDNIRRYRADELPEDLRFYCASDHAVGIGQRNDYTVLLKVGVDRMDNIWLVDCDWRRMTSDVAVEAMLTMGGGNMRPLVWWAERGHISKSIGPFLYKRMAETGVYMNIHEVTPANDKQQRAQSIAARVAMGKVYVPWTAPWAEAAINQMLQFPNGTFDDFVDALSYIGLGLQSLYAPSAPQSPAFKEPRFGTLAWVKRQDAWDEHKRRMAREGVF